MATLESERSNQNPVSNDKNAHRSPSSSGVQKELDFVDEINTLSKRGINVAAGAADSLTMGLSALVWPHVDVEKYINKAGNDYKIGVWGETAAEIGLTAGAMVLRHLARGVSKSAVRSAYLARTRHISRDGGQLHHRVPLFGHPGGKPAMFPSGGLPAYIHSSKLNLKRVANSAENALEHRKIIRAEKGVAAMANPPLTAVRILRNGTAQDEDS